MTIQPTMPSGEARTEEYHKRLDLLWQEGEGGISDSVRPFSSMGEAYEVFYGISAAPDLLVNVAGEMCALPRYPEPVDRRPRTPAESAALVNGSVDGTAFAIAVCDSMNRQILAQYEANQAFDWRSLVSQHRNDVPLQARFDKNTLRKSDDVGNFSTISSVPRNVELVGREILARETVRFEDMASGDTGAMLVIPSALASNYKQQQFEVVFGQISSAEDLREETSPGSKARYSVEAGNLSGHDLNSESLKSAVAAMQRHQMDDFVEQRPKPKTLFVSPEAREIAHALCADGFFKDVYEMNYRVVDQLADTNTWYLMARPGDGQDTIGCVTWPNELPVMKARRQADGNRNRLELAIVGSIKAAMLDHRMFHKAEFHSNPTSPPSELR